MKVKYLLLASVCLTQSFAGENGNASATPAAIGPESKLAIVSARELQHGPRPSSPLFPTGNWFRTRFSTPETHIELRPPVRLGDYVQDGKLELSLRGYLELVMANNTDIDIQRLSIDLQRNAITRAFGAFDPFLLGTFSSQRVKSPTNDALQGAATLNQLSQPTTFTYNQTIETGTQYNVGFTAQKNTTNSAFTNFNPSLTANLTFGFTQPLLRNRGAAVTRLPITIARSRLRSAEFNLRDQLMRLLVLAENTYWDVVGARETLRVQEKALELNLESLNRSRKELQLGAISALDIYQPEANYASAEIQVSQARFRVEQSEDALRRQIAADLDPQIRRLPVVLTEPVLPPTDQTEIDRETMVERALAMRPDLKNILQQIETDDLNIAQATNNMRPDLALTGRYGAAGRGGTFFDRQNVFGQSQIIRTVPGGFGDALDQLFGFGFPTYQFGLTLRLPIRDRVAESNLADAMINKRLDTLRARSQEQAIRQDVLQAVSLVESSKASIRLATVARDLAQKQLDAENRKYELGTNVIFFVLDAQNRLVQQEAQLVNQSIAYRRNLLNLMQRTGELLDERGIAIQ